MYLVMSIAESSKENLSKPKNFKMSVIKWLNNSRCSLFTGGLSSALAASAQLEEFADDSSYFLVMTFGLDLGVCIKGIAFDTRSSYEQWRFETLQLTHFGRDSSHLWG